MSVTQPKISVIIPVHNRIALTRKCLKSLMEQTYKQFVVIVVDDGSADGTSGTIEKEFGWVTVLRVDGDLWWAGATNLGIQKTLETANVDDYVLTLNNDTVCPPTYLLELVRCAEENPMSLIGSTSLNDQNRTEIVEAGVRINYLTAKYEALRSNTIYTELLKSGDPIQNVDALPGRGTLIPISVFKEVGIFDADQLPQYGADYEFSVRAKRNGYRLLVSHKAFLFSSVRTTGMNNQYAPLPWRKLASSFFSIRSPYSIRYRWNFARLICPMWLLPFFFLCDMGRLILGSLVNQFRTKRKKGE